MKRKTGRQRPFVGVGTRTMPNEVLSADQAGYVRAVGLVAGTGVSIDNTDPDQIIISASGGSGAGSAWSVLTSGDAVNPEIVYDSDGDVIMTELLR